MEEVPVWIEVKATRCDGVFESVLERFLQDEHSETVGLFGYSRELTWNVDAIEYKRLFAGLSTDAEIFAEDLVSLYHYVVTPATSALLVVGYARINPLESGFGMFKVGIG
jgi:hypothetical protein